MPPTATIEPPATAAPGTEPAASSETGAAPPIDFTAQHEQALREPGRDGSIDNHKREAIAEYRRRQAEGDGSPRWDGWSEFGVLVDGRPVRVIYEPDWLGGISANAHFEFHGPVSETGYYSHHAQLPEDRSELPPLEEYAAGIAAEIRAESIKSLRKQMKLKKSDPDPELPLLAMPAASDEVDPEELLDEAEGPAGETPDDLIGSCGMPIHPGPDDFIRQHDAEVRSLANDCNAARLEWESAKSLAAARKKVFDDLVDQLIDLSRQQPSYGPLFEQPSQEGPAPTDATDEAQPPADESWRDTYVSDLNLPDSLVAKLHDADLSTIGQLADYTAADKRLTDIKGIGQGKADKIADAMTAWFARHPEHCRQEAHAEATASPDAAEQEEAPSDAPEPAEAQDGQEEAAEATPDERRHLPAALIGTER